MLSFAGPEIFATPVIPGFDTAATTAEPAGPTPTSVTSSQHWLDFIAQKEADFEKDWSKPAATFNATAWITDHKEPLILAAVGIAALALFKVVNR